MSDLSYYLTPNTSMQAIPTVAVESAIARIEKLEADLAAAVAIIRAQSEHLPDRQFDPDLPGNGGQDRADWLAWKLNADAATIRRLLREDSEHE